MFKVHDFDIRHLRYQARCAVMCAPILNNPSANIKAIHFNIEALRCMNLISKCYTSISKFPRYQSFFGNCNFEAGDVNIEGTAYDIEETLNIGCGKVPDDDIKCDFWNRDQWYKNRVFGMYWVCTSTYPGWYVLVCTCTYETSKYIQVCTVYVPKQSRVCWTQIGALIQC
jgi:hypothetical protein